MAFDREAAKADGYTDEEIDQYLATKDQPLPPEQPRDRSEEQIGVATTAIPQAAITAAEIGGIGYGIKKLGDVIRGPSAPVAPVEPGASQRIMQQAMGRPGVATMPTASPPPMSAPVPQAAPAPAYSAQAQQPNVVQRGVDYAKQMQRIAAEKVIAGARAAGPAMASAGRAVAPFAAPAAVGLGAMTFSGGLNTNEAEELRRRQAMPNPYAR
jgi:hypothetical protein